MPKTITIRIDDDTYEMIKTAAEGERRSISNFIEYAAVNYLAEESFVTDNEMEEILNDKKLLERLEKSKKEIAEGKYRFAEE
ncbi:MAG: ParD-like family protein [Spirochaetales bacterium]|nr:ParD-like family protein [Spirochaetales bacterium]MCF7939928.1 ParD-like family protein [Spirochaetales bacterium]